MAKDKKKKKDAKKDKKAGGSAATASKNLKALTQNPLVADIVAAALVATASALKDSRKARQLAASAGDELGKLSKAGAKQGNALWDMALQIGRHSLEALSSEDAPKRAKAKPRSAGTAAGKATAGRKSR